jgi:uncharacterized OB-fold protein
MSDNVINVTAEWKKPFPNIDHDNAAFYEGLGRHELLLWRCTKCQSWYWPVCYCQHCDNGPFAAQMRWEKSSGKGKIFAFNIHHMAFHPAFQADLPYVYALIELDEGPLISSTLIGDVLPTDVHRVGQKVEVVYEDHPNEGFTLPRFRIIG